MDQTSRSRRGAPLPLCIAFRSLHRLKSQHAKNITQRTHNKRNRTCHNPRFQLSTRWRQFTKLTTARYRIKVPRCAPATMATVTRWSTNGGGHRGGKVGTRCLLSWSASVKLSKDTQHTKHWLSTFNTRACPHHKHHKSTGAHASSRIVFIP